MKNFVRQLGSRLRSSPIAVLRISVVTLWIHPSWAVVAKGKSFKVAEWESYGILPLLRELWPRTPGIVLILVIPVLEVAKRWIHHRRRAMRRRPIHSMIVVVPIVEPMIVRKVGSVWKERRIERRCWAHLSRVPHVRVESAVHF